MASSGLCEAGCEGAAVVEEQEGQVEWSGVSCLTPTRPAHQCPCYTSPDHRPPLAAPHSAAPALPLSSSLPPPHCAMVNPQYPTKAKGKASADADDLKKLEDDNRVCTSIRKLPPVRRRRPR